MSKPVFHIFSSEEVINESARFLAQKIIEQEANAAKVFLLISGGSAIEMYSQIFEFLPAELLMNGWTIGLVDERFGPAGHENSNETQLRNVLVIQNFVSRGAEFIGMLLTAPTDGPTTAQQISTMYQQLYEEADQVLVWVGLGEDGHTAGWLPTQTLAEFQQLYNQQQAVVYYEVNPQNSDNPFVQRLTTSLSVLQFADQVVMYIKGPSKKMVLQKLVAGMPPANELPASVLLQSSQPIEILTDQEVVSNL